VAERPITVTGCETINTSFPGFADLINECGGAITAPGAE
jgi:5-enolpyruvylshikimate-3-phosphate synthase